MKATHKVASKETDSFVCVVQAQIFGRPFVKCVLKQCLLPFFFPIANQCLMGKKVDQ